MTLIKSIAVFEELEAVSLIPTSSDFPSKKRKHISDHLSYLVITGGERGTLKFFKVEYQVPRKYLTRTHASLSRLMTLIRTLFLVFPCHP
jgi:hypothetical protein